MIAIQSPDVLIEICTYLELADVLSFLSVCSSFRELGASKYLWIDVLKRTQTRRSLACPVGTDFSQIDIDGLRRIAHLTYQVERNWRQHAPRVARAIKSTSYMPLPEANRAVPASILAVIPGTSLTVLYAEEVANTEEDLNQIILCDSEGVISPCCAPVGRIRHHAHYDETGRHLLAVTADSHSGLMVLIFSIEYGPGKIPSIQKIFQTRLALLRQPGPRGLFLCKDVVGMVTCPKDISSPPIRAINFAKNLWVNISTTPHAEFINTAAYICCSVVDGTPFIVGEDDQNKAFRVYRCPLDALPWDEGSYWEDGPSIDVEGGVVLAAVIATPEDDEWHAPEAKWSPLGFHALYLQQVVQREDWDTHSTYMQACFWSSDKTQPHAAQAGPSHTVATPGIYGKLGSYHGSDGSPPLLGSSPSGSYSTLVIDRFEDLVDQAKSLHLIIYDSKAPHIQMRPLDLPFYIDLEQIYSVAIDERYGVIYLSHIRGHLFTLPYA
ncbi:hypothetical protein FPV67DRAFT_1477570 [Lyophyllum atratum]|nr:hypothetical protein FPV67DRAFT_1477570 [Lyophyllum atratum]